MLFKAQYELKVRLGFDLLLAVMLKLINFVHLYSRTSFLVLVCGTFSGVEE